jgi:hypothetical protein
MITPAGPARYARYRVPARALLAFAAFAIALGAVLRFSWLWDMEYKYDEEWMFERSQAVPEREPWPTLGMTSSVGVRNPGFSAVVFIALAKLSGAQHPVALCQAVVTCNVLAFLILFVWVLRALPKHQQEPWLWALSLAAVNPLAVLLHRKIWAQSILPLFCVLFLIGWLRRDRAWGALLWGLVGALLGQIHMSGFFFAGGFFVWELALGRVRMNSPKTKWLAWFAGSLAGGAVLIPWLKYFLSRHQARPPYDIDNVLSLNFYRFWFSETFGLGLDHSLGDHYLEFLRYPLLLSRDLYLPMYLQGVSFSVGAFVIFCLGRAAWQRRAGALQAALGALRGSSEAAYTGGAALLGYGLLITLSGLIFWRFYLLVTFPIPWLVLAYVTLRFVPQPRWLLGVLWVVQLGLSVAFLLYIHEHHGAVDGDYGRGFRWQ